MASTRLINAQRDAIWARIEKHAFQARRDELKKSFEDLAVSCYVKFITPISGYQDATKIKAGWVGTVTEFYVKMGDQLRELELPREMIFPAEHAHQWSPTIGVCDYHDPLTQRWADLDEKKSLLEGEVLKAKSEAFSVLNKATTHANLKKAWPELLPLCADLLEGKVLPKQELVVAGSLNKNLGLPASEERK